MGSEGQINKLYKDEWKELDKWYRKGKEKIINIVSEPYQPLDLVYKLILDRMECNEKILYISKNREAIKILEEYKSIITYIDFSNIFKITDLYSLIILDDISSYSSKSEIEIIEYISFLLKKGSKIVVCTINNFLNNVKFIEQVNFTRKNHFIEPRIIATRLNLTESIPYLMYDYIKWFNKEKRNVIIYAPDSESGEEIYNYYINALDIQNKAYIIKSEKNQLLKDVERLKSKERSFIIITCELSGFLDYMRDVDYIFYFANHKSFDYKKIVFTCGSLTKDYSMNRELILLCNDETSNIEQAQNVTRRYNKVVWKE